MISKPLLVVAIFSMSMGCAIVEGTVIYRLAYGWQGDIYRLPLFVGGLLVLIPAWLITAHGFLNRSRGKE